MNLLKARDRYKCAYCGRFMLRMKMRPVTQYELDMLDMLEDGALVCSDPEPCANVIDVQCALLGGVG